MNQRLQTTPGFAGSGALAVDRNSVLRNTYWLLALSLVPTVLGAWVGVSTGITAAMGGGMSLIVLLGFTFFMGLMLSRLLATVLGFRNGSSLVMTAFGGTAVIFFAMATLSTVIKRDLSGMGKFLFVGALIVFVGFLVNFFLQSSALMLTLLVLCLGVFSAFMLYDIKRVVDGGETNYISATLAIYLDLFNVFQSLLALLGIFGGERE
jgi:modulator of FtsH protease